MYLAGSYSIDAAALHHTTQLDADLGLDSVAAYELIVTMEDVFGVRLDSDVISSIRTLGDLADWITAALDRGDT